MRAGIILRAQPAVPVGGRPLELTVDPHSISLAYMHTVTISALKAFPQELEAHYSAVPAEFKHWAPPSWDGIPSEPLTAIEHVCHVRDVEVDGYHVRFHRTLHELSPALASLDTGALAKERCYGPSDAAEALGTFRAARSKTVELIVRLTPEQLCRIAVFEGYGQVSLLGLVHYLCSHDQQHLAGLQWLLGQIESSRTAHSVGSVVAADR